MIVDGHLTRKAAHSVTPETRIVVTSTGPEWVSRAAEKLAAALDTWPIRVAGRRCLDIGASTGGFSQVLLARGARQVVALDVGHGQLHPQVAADPRVTQLDGRSVRDVRPGDLGGGFGLVVADVSFISLTHVLGRLAALLDAASAPGKAPDRPGTGPDAVVLVKPQFEVGKERLGRRGVVADPADRRAAIDRVIAAARSVELYPHGLIASPVRGSCGNIEYLLWLRREPSARMEEAELNAVLAAVARDAPERPVGSADDRSAPADAPSPDRGRSVVTSGEIQGTTAARRVLLLLHPVRPEALDLGREVAARLIAAGIDVVVPTEDEMAGPLHDVDGVHVAESSSAAASSELVCVLGGDGTILRGAELARGTNVPLLGINLGHVGFLAEAERDDAHVTVERIVARDYVVEERMTLEVVARWGSEEVFRSWALNEVTVEKASRERMIELTIEIDGRPLSTWGCDGIVMSTPTGSTAYGFSAGGPVIWPDVEALLLVPLSAHALFARALVLSPRAHLAVEILERTDAHGVVWCDGRRAVDLPPGSRIQVERSAEPVRLARFNSLPFTDRLVKKFSLPVHGWRGAAQDRSR